MNFTSKHNGHFTNAEKIIDRKRKRGIYNTDREMKRQKDAYDAAKLCITDKFKSKLFGLITHILEDTNRRSMDYDEVTQMLDVYDDVDEDENAFTPLDYAQYNALMKETIINEYCANSRGVSIGINSNFEFMFTIEGEE